MKQLTEGKAREQQGHWTKDLLSERGTARWTNQGPTPLPAQIDEQLLFHQSETCSRPFSPVCSHAFLFQIGDSIAVTLFLLHYCFFGGWGVWKGDNMLT